MKRADAERIAGKSCPLPYDVARCHGVALRKAGAPEVGMCPERETCQRYLQRATTGPQTLVFLRVCDLPSLERKIEA